MAESLDLRPFVDGPRLFDWRPERPPPEALAALLLRADTASGLSGRLSAQTRLPWGVLTQLTAAIARGDLTPTSAGQRFLVALKETKEARDGG